jgi:hypothetical protein
MPDYSHFQSKFRDERNPNLGIAAVRMESHKHGDDGGWHLKIDVRLGPHHEIMLEAIKSGFNALMKSLSPHGDAIHEENYYGEEAARQSDESLEDYYQQYHRKYIADDPWRSN